MQDSKKMHNYFSFFIYLRRGMSHICLVTFISFISYTKVHLFISYIKVQLIHFIIPFHLIHFTDHSPSHSHLSSLVMLLLHRISTSLSLSFFNQSRLWKLGVSKYILYHLKLNPDGITTPFYFIRITTLPNKSILLEKV